MVKISPRRMTMNIFSTYAPQAGLGEQIKAKFQKDLEGLIQMIPKGEKVIIGGDLNGHVGRDGTAIKRYMEGMDSKKLIMRVNLFQILLWHMDSS